MGLLELLIIIFFILWLVGMVASQTFGGLLHILLVVAVIILIFRLIRGSTVV